LLRCLFHEIGREYAFGNVFAGGAEVFGETVEIIENAKRFDEAAGGRECAVRLYGEDGGEQPEVAGSAIPHLTGDGEVSVAEVVNLGGGDLGVGGCVDGSDVSVPGCGEMLLGDALVGVGDGKVFALGEAIAKRLGGPGRRKVVGEQLRYGVDEAAGIGDGVDVRGEFVQPESFIGEVVGWRHLATACVQESRR